MLLHEAAHRAAQALDRPRLCGFQIQHPHDVLPGVSRPHPSDRRKPGVHRSEQGGDIDLVTGGRYFLQGLRAAFPQARIARQVAAGPCRLDPRLGAL